jgi:hypothetical protein
MVFRMDIPSLKFDTKLSRIGEDVLPDFGVIAHIGVGFREEGSVVSCIHG